MSKERSDSTSSAVFPAFYRPSAWYWRKDIREAVERGDLRALEAYALALVSELELHKAAIRECGLMPPKHHLAPSEADAKPHLVSD